MIESTDTFRSTEMPLEKTEEKAKQEILPKACNLLLCFSEAIGRVKAVDKHCCCRTTGVREFVINDHNLSKRNHRYETKETDSKHIADYPAQAWVFYICSAVTMAFTTRINIINGPLVHGNKVRTESATESHSVAGNDACLDDCVLLSRKGLV